jgi:hypothetical protein
LEYNKTVQLFLKGTKRNDSLKEERDAFIVQVTDEFSKECLDACSSMEVLTNILVDICYASNKSKTFAWDVAGEQIFQNVLNNNNNTICYPVKDENGDIEFCGKKFSLYTQKIGGDSDVNLE